MAEERDQQMPAREIQRTLENGWIAAALVILIVALTRGLVSLKGTASPLLMVADCVIFARYLISFFLGNIRYLDQTFFGSQKTHSRARVRVGYDVVLLLLHAVALGGMALSLADIRSFQEWVIVLLLTDLWWLVYEPRTRPTSLRRMWAALWSPLRSADVDPLPLREEYLPRTWMLNNLAIAILLYACLRIAGPESCTVLNFATMLLGIFLHYADVDKAPFAKPQRGL